MSRGHRALYAAGLYWRTRAVAGMAGGLVDPSCRQLRGTRGHRLPKGGEWGDELRDVLAAGALPDWGLGKLPVMDAGSVTIRRHSRRCVARAYPLATRSHPLRTDRGFV